MFQLRKAGSYVTVQPDTMGRMKNWTPLLPSSNINTRTSEKATKSFNFGIMSINNAINVYFRRVNKDYICRSIGNLTMWVVKQSFIENCLFLATNGVINTSYWCFNETMGTI